MKAAVMISETAPLDVREVADPRPGPDDAVVDVAATGVCGTDAHLWAGHWRASGIAVSTPRILGHEMAGTVREVGSNVLDIAPGDRVTIPFHLSCGRCVACLSGLSNRCPRAEYLGSSVDGGFAELVRVPRADLNCVRLPDGVDFYAGATLGCRYMTAFRGLVDLARIEAGEKVVIIGSAGGLGAAARQLTVAFGAQPIGIDLRERLDAADPWSFAAEREDLVEAVIDATDGGPQVVFNATGAPNSLVNSLRMLRAGGRHIQAGLTSAGEAGILPAAADLLTAKELQVLGVSGNPHVRYRPLLSLVEEGLCHPAELISHEISFEQLTESLDELLEHRAEGIAVLVPSR